MVKARTDRELSCAICALKVEEATFVRRRALPHGEWALATRLISRGFLCREILRVT